MKRNVFEYDRFYGICMYNYFWKLFQIWDLLAYPNVNTLSEYHLIN